ncbi:hypothetical protein [Thalassotalea litorea]|uniref:hypothetical protein n=1 Tax=Thalassotalea litorea TaxID=2020715 RepID=UPI003734F874
MKFMEMLKKLTRPKNAPNGNAATSRVRIDINYVESKLTPEDLKSQSEPESSSELAKTK